jgi:hypothetical protein
MKRLLLPVLAALLLVTGCAGPGAGDAGPNPDAPPLVGDPGEGESAALGLVNLWRVSGAEGESEETWLRLEAQEFQLWRDCGMIMGSWVGSETVFLGSAFGASGDCATDGMPTIAWLDEVAGFVATPAGYELVDAAGASVAALTIDGAPHPIATAAEFYTRPPEITDEVRTKFRTAAALPASLAPASAASLAGKWVPVAYSVATDPHVKFTADGTWTGSDGCNGGSGRWAVGAAGEFLATSGPSTLIGCEGAPVPSWVAGAWSAGLNADGWLLLFDTAGTEIGRLEAG